MTVAWQPTDWMTPYPRPLGAAAYHGVIGEIVKTFEPQVEADAVSILAPTLVGLGSMLGRNPTTWIGATSHHPRLFALVIGPTSARKGTGQDVADAVLGAASPHWRDNLRGVGLASGEGLIKAVRDKVMGREPVRRGKGKDAPIEGYQDVVLDPGVDDKRLMVVEEEFARVLRGMQRDGNILGEVLRACWDGKAMGVMTKERVTASGHHISIAAHITPPDLRTYLAETDKSNGMANRFLYFAVRRARELARAPRLEPGQINYFGGQIAAIIEEAMEREEWILDFDERAQALWDRSYSQLSRERKGIVNDLCGRAPAQVRRLALLYAALDLADAIELPHLRAAQAVWRYSEDTVACFFGTGTGDPVQDRILALLAEQPRSTTEISNNLNRKVENLGETLELMGDNGLISMDTIPTKGRSRTVWSLRRPDEEGDDRA